MRKVIFTSSTTFRVSWKGRERLQYSSGIYITAIYIYPLRALRTLNDLTILSIGTDIDWQYRTTNEMNACLSTGGSCSWPRGKNLGGTSVHNGMMYKRGHAKDFDNWAAMGNVGWSWRDVRFHRLASNYTHISSISFKLGEL